MAALTAIVIDYMDEQAKAGAAMLQVFEAMGAHITPEAFDEFALPCLRTIAQELKKRHPGTPLLVFTRDAMHANEKIAALGYDVITLDLSVTDRPAVRAALAAEAAARGGGAAPARVQGNFDPRLLYTDGGASDEEMEAAVRAMIGGFGPQGLIANLGEGLCGKEDPARVSKFVDLVHSVSEELIAHEKAAVTA